VLTLTANVAQWDRPSSRARVLHTAGSMPRDVSLKLPCGAEVEAVGMLLKAASPFFLESLGDVQGARRSR
jgi:hypothetical protein